MSAWFEVAFLLLGDLDLALPVQLSHLVSRGTALIDTEVHMATEQHSRSQEEQNQHHEGAASETSSSGTFQTESSQAAQGEGTGEASGSSRGHAAPGSTSERSAEGTQRQGGQGIARGRGQSGMSRAGGSGLAGPFSLMRRISADMDRLFEGFFGPSALSGSSLFGGSSGSLSSESPFGLGRGQWPEIEVHQEGDRLVIQADLPGLNREDVHVEMRDQHVLITGERRTQTERNEGGFYHSERSYGSFSRAIPLPENANAESASASFENGVLRVEIEARENERPRGRRVEIREGKPQ